MAGVNIGPRIGIEGESEFRKQMNQIIQSTKTLKTEMKATESSFSASDSAMKKASERSKILSREIENQKKHIVTTAENSLQCSSHLKFIVPQIHLYFY